MVKKIYSSDKVLYGNKNSPYDKLMIIAHPDDELIFGGKYLLNYDKWKIICITNGTIKSSNKRKYKRVYHARIQEFKEVMKQLTYNYEIWDFEDSHESDGWDEKLLKEMLKKILKNKTYTMVVTHNRKGEYGHIQHKKIFHIVFSLLQDWRIHQHLYVFNYSPSVPNYRLSELDKLCEIYETQKRVFEKYRDYVKHQSIKKIM